MLNMGGEMEGEASQYGSGCESGWTMYLGQSCESPASLLDEGGAPDEEEDLSMVSDASSGPPHAHEDDDCCHHHLGEKNNACCFSASSPFSPAAALHDKCWKRRRVETEQRNQRQAAATALLDDTASSPFLGFSGNVRRLLLHQQNCKSASFGISNNNLCSNKTLVEGALEFSYDFSATYLKGKTTLQKPLHYMKPTSAKPVRNGEVGKNIQ
ncbi:hypothetical protein Taro_023780 [Colocasia esculenta]|uniref:Uncharacterized protein n=1 Tax=Colocasia esculenta TaxID=4460 RepID=A0A843VCG1_COLES|nr:hypothetical protein [Colocasia esculenta]